MNHRYQILEQIGKGGTGTVFAVRDLFQGARAVALKRANSPEMNDLLVEEYDRLRACAHPVLPRVYDCGVNTEKGTFYYTMEWCRGGTLAQWLKGDRTDESKLLLLARLIDCVSTLHSLGVIHGDLSLLNVVVKETLGELNVKLLDLGFAGRSGDAGVSGALEFMAPECLEGAPKSGASDVFSLGLLAYRVLFGEHPFGNYPKSPVKKVLYPSGHSGIRRALREGLDRALAERPENRPENAAALLQLLPMVRDSLDWQTVLLQRLDRVSEEIPLLPPIKGVLYSETRARQINESGYCLHWIGDVGFGKSRAIRELENVGKKKGVRVATLKSVGSEVRLSALQAPLQVLYEDAETGEERIDASMPMVYQQAIRSELSKREQGAANREQSLLADPTTRDTEHLDALVRGTLWSAQKQSIWLTADNWESLDEGSQQFLRRLSRAVERGIAPGLFLITAGRKAFASGVRQEGIDLPPWDDASFSVVGEAFFPGQEVSRELEREWMTRGGGVPGRIVQTILEFAHLECLTFVGSEVRLNPLKKKVVERMRGSRAWAELGSEHFEKNEWTLLMVLQTVGCALRPRELAQLAEMDAKVFHDILESLTMRGIVESVWLDGERCVGLNSSGDALPSAQEILGVAWCRTAASMLEKSSMPGARIAGLKLRIQCHGGDGKELKAILEHLGMWAEQGRWSDLMPLLSALERAQPGFSEEFECESLLLKGKALRGMGKLEGAEQVLLSAMKHPNVTDSMAMEARTLLCSVQALRGQYSSAIENLEVALAHEGLTPTERGELSYWLAFSSLHLGKYDEVLDLEAESGAYLKQTNENHRQVRSRLLRTSGLAHLYRGNGDEAREFFRKARGAAEGLLLELASVDSCLALLHFRDRHMDSALTVYKRALSYMEQAGARVKQGALLMNLGVVYQGSGSLLDAREQYLQALEIAELLEDELGAFRVRNNLANVSLKLGALDDAESYVKDARSSGLGPEQPYLETFNITLLGEIARERGHYEESAALLSEALERFEQMENIHESLEVRIEQAMLYLRRGDTEQAAIVANECVTKYREEKLNHGLVQALSLAAEAERRMPTGDLERAGLLIKEALDAAEEEEQISALWYALLVASRIYRDKGNLEAAREDASRGVELLRGAVRQLEPASQSSFLSVQERGAALEEFRWVESLANFSFSPVEKKGGDTLVGSKLLEINKRLNTERNLERLLEFIMDSAVFLTGAERGFLILTNEGEEDDWKFRVARNIDQENIAKSNLKISNSIAARVLESGEPIVTIDAMEDDRYREMLSVHQQKLRSVLCLPLRRSGRVMGVLYIDNRFQLDAFGKDEMDFMEAFADQAAIAIGNASLFEESQRARAALEQSQMQVQELNRQLEEKLERTNLALRESRTKVRRQQAQLENRHEYRNLVGASDQLREVLYKIDRIKDVDVPALITGESGTGKELVARAIHYNGSRKQTEIVAVNCGAIPANLFESVLFGHVRGAFTGASQEKAGLFEVAHKGTLFLDELGEMPLDLQVKLLRVLQSGEFQRLGENRTRRSDVRIIAATNRDLREEVKAKRFREDLFYRLNVISIALPPLRDRMDDLPLLIQHFIEANLEKGISKVERISAEALQFMGQYRWPGNIRELDTIIKNASLFCTGECLEVADFSHLPQLFSNAEGAPISGAGSGVPLGKPLAVIEREAIIGTLESLGGNKKKTAEVLGIDRRTLYNKLEVYGVTIEKTAKIRGK